MTEGSCRTMARGQTACLVEKDDAECIHETCNGRQQYSESEWSSTYSGRDQLFSDHCTDLRRGFRIRLSASQYFRMD